MSVESETPNTESVEMRPDREERATEDAHVEEEEEEVMKKINTRSLVYSFRIQNSYKNKCHIHH